ncbi:Short-chain dehydrogenase [Loktanella fryxellensis]|uniref:Short-chain dehydrogenase n=1 Tax=Loktanella fryxellensis TaxID=245187 RepID=A0A1H8IL00_9RHOB|nr:SDR family NAD(P)-dependent oxidoreductase [Loktanella fryxellensis]SEN69184.1 Short-chain dehydrogenase [Loktanella fryxellensis]
MKTVLITGCSSGIGLDAAHGLRDAGWRVFASCRRQADSDRLIAAGFDSPLIDYADPDSITAGLAHVLAATGGTLDALYNNGAFACPGAVEDLPRAALEAIFQTNLFGVHDLTRQVIPVMRAQGHGRIVNCSSVLGLVGYRWRGAYVATKFALEGLTDVLRLEMRDTAIKVILLEPGPIASRIRENAIPHFERWIDPAASARAAQYVALTDRLYHGGDDKFQLPASAVTAKLRHALEHPRPKARYYITTPTYIAAAMRRLLPTWAQDALIARN